MKISVQLEAGSAEELLAFFATFAAAPVPRPITETPVTVRVPEPVPAPVEPEPVIAEAPVDVAPAEPKRRGRPRKEPAAEPTVVPQPVAAVVPQSAPEVPAAGPQANGEDASLTRQDLLDAFAEYVQRYGASFGYTDISKLLQTTLGDTVRKASDVPEQALPKAITAIKEALANNPFNRKRDYA